MASVEFPDVVRWFQYLDEHEQRSKDGIQFSPYGIVLRDKGFLRVNQLTLDFLKLTDLQEWLGMNVGTAVMIMQYAKEDVDAIKGGWVFPQ
jgi:hypothetical protein